MDRTVKIPAYTGQVPPGLAQDNLTKEQKLALELATRNTQLEEEKHRAQEHIKTIEQLRDKLNQEQSNAAAMAMKVSSLEAKVDELNKVLDKIAGIAAARKVSTPAP